MPDDFRVILPNQNRGFEEAISWFELDYRYPTIDLRGLHELTSHELPDSVIVVPPELNQFSKMTVLVGVTGEQAQPNPDLVARGELSYQSLYPIHGPEPGQKLH